MTARKTKPVLDAEEAGIPVDEDTTQPVKAARKPREAKPVTDLPTANAAFLKAKAHAEKVNKRAEDAKRAAEHANADVTTAARVLKGYMNEVDTALAGALPVAADEAPPVQGWDDEIDASDVVDAPYEGDGHGDTAHTA
jgi:hypothetical protein